MTFNTMFIIRRNIIFSYICKSNSIKININILKILYIYM